VKYALLGYDSEGALGALAAEKKRSLHAGHRALHDDAAAAISTPARVIAHYRFRPPRHATTVRLAADKLVKTDGPATETSHALRALYLLESEDHDAVIDLAARLPAIQMGGTVEVWPLTEPTDHPPEPRRH
jgi:hypothetical protein